MKNLEVCEVREIPGLLEYRVTSNGTVLSCRGRAGKARWIPLTACLRKGYPTVTVQRSTRSVSMYVHRLVLEAFVGPCPTGMQACHFNGVRTDNRAANLRWDTPAGNSADMDRHGTRPMGEAHHAAKLTSEQVKYIRAARKAHNKTVAELAKMFGVSIATISDIARKKRWRSTIEPPKTRLAKLLEWLANDDMEVPLKF
jgi:hypothetical protein